MIKINPFSIEFGPFNSTTPSLDFEIGSQELESTIDKLLLIKQKLLTLPDDEQLENGKSILVTLAYKVLCRFNTLTRPERSNLRE
jgi:hypothetical protein